MDKQGNIIWEHSYLTGYSYITAVKQTFDGGFVLVGTCWQPARYSDIFLLKTNSSGVEQWVKTYGGADMDFGGDIVQTPDYGFLFTSLQMDTLQRLMVTKTDYYGAMLWQKSYSGDHNILVGPIPPIIQTVDGGFVVGSSLDSVANSDSFDWNYYLCKIDAWGSQQWAKLFAINGNDILGSIKQISDGSLVIVGFSGWLSTKGERIILIKTDISGNELFKKVYDYGGAERAYSLIVTNDGGYAIVGSTSSFGAGSSDMLFIKTDANGDSY